MNGSLSDALLAPEEDPELPPPGLRRLRKKASKGDSKTPEPGDDPRPPPGYRLAYNAGVVGGSRRAFLALATAMEEEMAWIYAGGRPPGAPADAAPPWNCDMSALQALVAQRALREAVPVFDRGTPFCSGSIKCTLYAECDTYVYHK